MATKRQPSKARTTTGSKRATRNLDAIVRVSRLNGREGDSFHSVDMQKAAITAWAKAHDARIRKWFDESDSVSGGTTNREGLQTAMTRAVESRVTDGIIVSNVDRFARNMVE